MDAMYKKLESWFPDIPSGDIRGRRLLRYEKGTYLFYRNRPFRSVLLILDGCCDVVNRLDNGGDIITLKLKEGDVVGASECVLDLPRYLASVLACSTLWAMELSGNEFFQWLDSSPCFRRYILKNMVVRLHYTADTAANCRTGSAKVNLAKYLLDRYTFLKSTAPCDDSGSIIIRESHEMIASYLGVSVRTIDRQVKQLREAGLIHTLHGKIHISAQQFQALMKFAD